jgi:lipopolysaccharide export system protein LptC
MILEITSPPFNVYDKGTKTTNISTKTAHINTEMIQSVVTHYVKVNLPTGLTTSQACSKIIMSDGFAFYADMLPREISSIINNNL